MAAADLPELMLGLEERLDTIAGLKTGDTKPSQITPPWAFVGVPPIPQYHLTQRMGFSQFAFTVTVLVGAVADRQAQRKLAGYANPAGALSVRAAIEADATLGGRAETCIVTEFRPLGIEEVGALQYYGGLWVVDVTARGA